MPTKSPRTQARRGQARRGTTSEAAAAGGDGPRTAKVKLPFVTAEFRVPQVHLPHLPASPIRREEVVAAAQTARSYLPPPRQALYFGGLALMAVVDVIEWPVAAAIGIGTAVAGAARRESGQPARTQRSAASGSR
jgi:hypothetical protein